MTKLEEALEQALRWKIALDAANRGARRKSRQARAWRAKAEQLTDELKWLRRAKDTLTEELSLERYNNREHSIATSPTEVTV